LGDYTFGKEHFEDLMAEDLFQVFLDKPGWPPRPGKNLQNGDESLPT